MGMVYDVAHNIAKEEEHELGGRRRAARGSCLQRWWALLEAGARRRQMVLVHGPQLSSATPGPACDSIY